MKRFLRFRQSLTGALTAALLVMLFSATVFAAPSAAAEDCKGLIGLYRQDEERLLIRERDGQLELLYGVGGAKDEWLQNYVSYPLQKTAADTYRLNCSGPLGTKQAVVKFICDDQGWGVRLKVGSKEYVRHFFGPEKGQIFRINPLLPAEQLRSLAQAAQPPHEQGIFLVPDLVDITAFDWTIKMDIRYATTNNFMGMAFYDQPRALLQRSAAEALVRAHRTLEKYGYGLIIYDAYRPWAVTKMFWDATPDNMKVFVADPSKGSRHNRGGAVDVSLYDLRTGQPVGMISGYDEFSLRAVPTYAGGTTLERWQRDLLRLVMEGEGFSVYPEEWWHFDFHEWQKYPIMNIPLDAVPRGLQLKQ